MWLYSLENLKKATGAETVKVFENWNKDECMYSFYFDEYKNIVKVRQKAIDIENLGKEGAFNSIVDQVKKVRVGRDL